MTPMSIPAMLHELAAVLASDEYQRDPAGCLHAWADVVSGRVRPTDRAVVGNGACAGYDEIALVVLSLAATGPIRNRDVRRAIGDVVSPETVRQRCADLCERGLLLRRGAGRGTWYVAAPAERP